MTLLIFYLPPGLENDFLCPGVELVVSNLTRFSVGESGFVSEGLLLLIAIIDQVIKIYYNLKMKTDNIDR